MEAVCRRRCTRQEVKQENLALTDALWGLPAWQDMSYVMTG
jgi:hypothetical protein